MSLSLELLSDSLGQLSSPPTMPNAAQLATVWCTPYRCSVFPILDSTSKLATASYLPYVTGTLWLISTLLCLPKHSSLQDNYQGKVFPEKATRRVLNPSRKLPDSSTGHLSITLPVHRPTTVLIAWASAYSPPFSPVVEDHEPSSPESTNFHWSLSFYAHYRPSRKNLRFAWPKLSHIPGFYYSTTLLDSILT